MFVGGFEISGQAVFVGAFKACPDCRSSKALALMCGVAACIMQIPDRFFG